MSYSLHCSTIALFGYACVVPRIDYSLTNSAYGKRYISTMKMHNNYTVVSTAHSSNLWQCHYLVLLSVLPVTKCVSQVSRVAGHMLQLLLAVAVTAVSSRTTCNYYCFCIILTSDRHGHPFCIQSQLTRHCTD